MDHPPPTDLALQDRAEALHRACTPDPFCESTSQARANAEQARRDLRDLLQGVCPEGVRFTGVQSTPSRHLYCFNVETVGGTSFSLEPEKLGAARIAAEHNAALARMAREAQELSGGWPV